MKTRFDIGDFVDSLTIPAATEALVARMRARRQSMNFTQKDLASRSGVSYASVRRFELLGEISLQSLLKIAMALDCLEDFNMLFRMPAVTNLKDL